MATDLFTLAEYKAYAGISSTNQDAAIKNIIPKASQLCKTYCRRTFVDYFSDAKEEIHEGGDFLLLGEYPIVAVSSVEYSSDYGATYTALTEFTDFATDRVNHVIVPINSEGSFPAAVNGYKVTYTAGFEEIPEDLKIAVMDLCTYYLKNDMAVKSQRDAGSNTVQIEYITKNTLPSHIARVFDLYLANVS
jgi:hypothetical protein